MENELEGYIKRAVVDIARKCNTKEDIVIQHFKKLVGCVG